MNLTPSEQATLNFYEWEYLGRGYYHFDEAIHIEPPYVPFYHSITEETPFVDDGKVPSLFKRVINVFTDTSPTVQKEKELPLIPTALKPLTKLTSFTISFPKGQDISQSIALQFLNMLAFSNNVFSFEILGTQEKIDIQIVCGTKDEKRVQGNLKAYFPQVSISNIEPKDLPFDLHQNIAIADFGLHDEYMRPLESVSSFSIDPLTSIIATLENLNDGELALVQILFKGVSAPWSKDMLYAVSDGQGGSFFKDAPEMPSCTKEKTSNPLFACVFRIATQGVTDTHSQNIAQELAQNITSISDSQLNKLIPLTNEGYDYDDHVYNVYHRTSSRLGMILNSSELATFVHYPNKSIVSEKLHPLSERTKSLPIECLNQSYTLGINTNKGIENLVSINDIQRLQHCHIIGATGVGKSILIANMMLQDIHAGNGCALFDPHGDISEDILLRIPEHRKDDVIIIDPSDTDYPIGFNLLRASFEVEKIVLSSDLVSSFKRYATSWGDNMTAVLSNVINTFLESTRGGTLIELKRFLLEESFRKQFLKTVDDRSLHYYWHYEYPMVKNRIAPLLTRIDTFLRPKIIRSMFAQKEGIDFNEIIENKKIVVIKLSLGLIGEENSYLLGSLFLSKINQVAHSRQTLPKNERHPYYLYLDEFHNYMTSSVVSMLSGARKYGIGLTMAHQELGQIESSNMLNSVISNPYIRICFRLGDNDARKLENGFSFFEQADLQNLNIGEAIMKVGGSSNDFNMTTYLLADIDINNSQTLKEYVIQNTHNTYATPKEEVEKMLNALLPHPHIKNEEKEIIEEVVPKPMEVSEIEVFTFEESSIPESPKSISKELKAELIKHEVSSMEIRTHRYLQTVIKKLGQERNFIAHVEYPTNDGGRIDVVLEQDALKIAFEISETNRPDYEVKNIRKCLKSGCIPVIVVSKNKKHLNKIEKLARKGLSKKDIELVRFLQPDSLTSFLDEMLIPTQRTTEMVKGFRVETEFENEKMDSAKSIKSRIAKLLKKKR